VCVCACVHACKQHEREREDGDAHIIADAQNEVVVGIKRKVALGVSGRARAPVNDDVLKIFQSLQVGAPRLHIWKAGKEKKMKLKQ
jgi:hypothetical protein